MSYRKLVFDAVFFVGVVGIVLFVMSPLFYSDVFVWKIQWFCLAVISVIVEQLWFWRRVSIHLMLFANAVAVSSLTLYVLLQIDLDQIVTPLLIAATAASGVYGSYSFVEWVKGIERRWNTMHMRTTKTLR